MLWEPMRSGSRKVGVLARRRLPRSFPRSFFAPQCRHQHPSRQHHCHGSRKVTGASCPFCVRWSGCCPLDSAGHLQECRCLPKSQRESTEMRRDLVRRSPLRKPVREEGMLLRKPSVHVGQNRRVPDLLRGVLQPTGYLQHRRIQRHHDLFCQRMRHVRGSVQGENPPHQSTSKRRDPNKKLLHYSR
jgi:hypothetical protein